MGPEKPIPYINDIIHSKGATFKLHLDILDKIFQHLGKAGMQVNADKSKFFSQALKFLGFTLTPTRYHLLKKQVEAIKQVTDAKLQEKLKDKKKQDDFGMQKYDSIEVTMY